MLQSQFNLAHRLAELRSTESERRNARELRKAGSPASRPARSAGEPSRNWFSGGTLGSHLSRPAAS
jgi:hypothetical protein